MKSVLLAFSSLLALSSIVALTGCNESSQTKSGQPNTPEVSENSGSAGTIVAEPLVAVTDREEGVPFFHLYEAKEVGIEFTNSMTKEQRMLSAFPDSVAELASGNVGNGVSSGDYDGDGLTDLYFVAQSQPDRLYRQVEPWRFEDVTEKAGNIDGGEGVGTGPAFADVDNDGDLDLYVCLQKGPDKLYINQGDGTFTEEGKARGLGDEGPGIMAAFCDYDRDGDLDCYLLRNFEPGGGVRVHAETVERKKALLESGISVEESEIRKVGLPDLLYRNDGAGNFTEVSKEAGIAKKRGMGLSATWWDANNDQWPDLFVANDFSEPDRYYHNMGDGTFEEIAAEAFSLLPWFSMGSDAADLNNDGMLDVIATDMAGTTHYEQKIRSGDMGVTKHFLTYSFPKQLMTNTVFLNAGVGRFMETSRMMGLNSSDWTWAVRIADYDNDGLQDVFFSNGFYANARDSDRQLARQMISKWEQERGKLAPGEPAARFVDHLREQGFVEEVYSVESRPPLAQRNLVFKNKGDLKFENVTSEWGLDEEVVSFGVTVTDLDGDGDVDIVANGLDGSIRLYRNDSDSGNRVAFALRGTQSNFFGIGARVTAKTKSGMQVRLLRASRGYQGGDQPEVYFGLAENEVIDELTVEWPSGVRQEFADLAAGQRYTITEPGGEAGEIQPASPPRFGPPENAETLFVEEPSAAPRPMEHIEQYHHDYADQLLLPFQLSQMGPGVAVADVTGNGKEEIWLGGAFGQRSQLAFRDEEGVRRIFTDWGADQSEDASPEDMGGLFFDADVDGDMDLYVVSGGVEAGVGSEHLRDRLYLNEGGSFRRAPEGTLPELRDSGSVVCAGDFDRDGDLDLFIGGRSVPQQYPADTQSRFLINEGGTFLDATADVFGSESVVGRGMVTSAIWSDVNADGWLDVLVTQEWGPVRTFLNREGKFEDVTSQSGIGDKLGWWNGIAAGDIDNDGDIDYAVSNWGLNTKYSIKNGKPQKIYYSDFDENGDMDIVEAKYDGDNLVPVRGRSCTTTQMPSLAKTFTTFRKFALATLPEIYTPQKLDEALSREANFLGSAILINDGNGKFELRELPRLAQVSPSFGLALQDFDADGNLDLLMTHNFYPNQIETKPDAGGLGLFLRGDGQGSFVPVWPLESGFYVPEDARSLAIADLNEDHWPDVIVGLNNGPAKTFIHRGQNSGGRMLQVNLEGPKGNKSAIGAMVTFTTDKRILAQEVYAGGSYLSQSTPDLFFGISPDEEIRSISVRWPEGTVNQFVEGFDGREMTIKYRGN